MKKNIIHVIDDLGRGGAETMLVAVAKHLHSFNNIIITLYPRNEFSKVETGNTEIICLNMSSRLHIPFAMMRLKKILSEKKADIVHSHLFWATVLARLSVPKKIPLFTTIHAFVASSIEYQPWRMRMIERWTYKIRHSQIIAVAKGALDEYFNFIKVKPYNAVALYTFVDTSIFHEREKKSHSDGIFKLVTVGNLKPQKNHQFLLEAFKKLKQEKISLDIYGNGFLEAGMQKTIAANSLPILLKGQAKNIEQVLGHYDLFVMPSLYEGFALSVLEAMATGVPLLLTDISSFKEQCENTAAYFTLNDLDDFVKKVIHLRNNKEQLNAFGSAAKKRVMENFTLQHHLNQLEIIYAKEI